MKTRILSAIALVAIVLPFLYFGGQLFVIGIGIVSILGYIEMLNLPKSHKPIPMIPMIIGLISLLVLICTNFNVSSVMESSNYTRLIFLILGLLIPVVFYKDEKYTTKDAIYLIGCILFLSLSFNSFILVRDEGLSTFVFLMLIPIMTDSFAMIFGSLIGKHKMCPKISPKKSWEGSVCGGILGTIIPMIFHIIVLGPINIKIIIMIFILSCMGQIGDLIFSKIKRENGIKDYSNLIPGHGGILDRLDSAVIIFLSYIFLSSVLF